MKKCRAFASKGLHVALPQHSAEFFSFMLTYFVLVRLRRTRCSATLATCSMRHVISGSVTWVKCYDKRAKLAKFLIRVYSRPDSSWFVFSATLSTFVHTGCGALRCTAVSCGAARHRKAPLPLWTNLYIIRVRKNWTSEHWEKKSKTVGRHWWKNSCKKSKMDVGVWCTYDLLKLLHRLQYILQL